MNCKNCIHNSLCEYAAKEHRAISFLRASIENVASDVIGSMDACCNYFQDKDEFIKLQHGSWTNNTFGYTCSCCEALESAEREYCPACGAKMDLKEEETDGQDERPA